LKIGFLLDCDSGLPPAWAGPPTGVTSFKGWWGVKPNLWYLKLFGARVCVKRTGDQRSKLDKHNFTGLFLGYTSTDQNIRYLDLDSGNTKTCHHTTFDEAWYLQDARPPAAELLYRLGLEDDTSSTTCLPDRPIGVAYYPPQTLLAPALPDTAQACMCHLPLHLSPAPHPHSGTVHSINRSPHLGTCIVPAPDDTTTSLSYGVSATDITHIYMSPTPYNEAFEKELDLCKYNFSHHRAAGMIFLPQDDRLILASMAPSTLGTRIPRWRTRLRGAWLLLINGTPVHTLAAVHQVFHDLSLSRTASCILLFAHPKLSHGLSNTGLPLLHRDQIPQLSIDQLSNRWTSTLQPPPDLPKAPTWDIVIDGDVWNVVTKVMKLTRGKLMKQDDWTNWNESKHLQLDQYDKQFMFGDPVAAEDELAIFHLVWTYVVKELDGRKKARCVCNGLSRSGQVRVLDHTYANCIDRTGSRIFYATSAAENMLVYGADVPNAFAVAPPPKQGFYIYPDRAFQDWWVNKKGKPPIPNGHVIPVLGAMQGHPESPRLWEKHIDRILRDIGLTPTIHKPCIYSGLILGKRVLFMWQVDNFAIPAPSQHIANHLLGLIDDKLSIPLKRQGLVTLYNGLDILQTKDYIKVSCETYIDQVSNIHLDHGWMKSYLISDHPTPLPTTHLL
jgi:hypothetical protein